MKTKLSFTRLLLLFWCGLVPVFSFAQQIPKSLTAANGTFIGFWEYKPVDYSANPNRKYPLIIFLHGVGERGDGTTQLGYVLANAIPRYINAGHTMTFTYNGQTETFMVLSPQLRGDLWSWPTFYVEEMIKYAKQNLHVDTNRIYLTGLSLGGGGVWKYASESYANAKGLAAIAPVCGVCDWTDMCSSIAAANLPVWAFHAQDDQVVGYGCTLGAVESIKVCNPSVQPLMTIYPNGNHYIWDRSYDTTHSWHNPNMYEWFLSKSRGGSAAPGPNVPPIARAGNDQSITLPVSAVTVDGSASSDPDGSIAGYSWAKIGGPAQYNIVSPNGASTVINNLAQGVYSFQLTVTDNRGATARDTVLVTVGGSMPSPNQPPVSLGGADQAITLPTNNTYLFGSASYDPDGFITNYAWTQVGGPSGATITQLSATNINVSNLAQGQYKFRLVVTDNMGATDDDTVDVNVSSPNIKPVANAGADQSIQLPTSSVTLNGAGSTDADGNITGYSWSKISGPAQYNITSNSSASTGVTNLAAGTYLFRLQVTDDRGDNDDDTVIVTVAAAPPPPNIAPNAIAGPDQSIQLPTSSVTLDGAASNDPDGTITAYSWSKISGPAQYNIASGGSASTAVTNLAAGTYSFRLVVTDNNGATDDDTVIVNVAAAPPPPNIAPNAIAGPDQSIQLPTSSVTLDGAASNDPDGTITTYSWSKISGPAQYNIASGGSASTAITNLAAGTYSFRLVVTDNNGATDDDTVIVNVAAAPPPPNIAPNAIAGPDQSIQLPTNNATLNGSASNDPDGIITGYAWSYVSGPAQYNIANTNSTSTAVTNLAAGTYSFRLVVTDNNGATGSDTVVIVVSTAPPPQNIPPTANAGNDVNIQLPTSNVTLDGSASSDADGSISSYSWSKISGPVQYNIANATHATTQVNNLVMGTYLFRLVVTDNNGATDADTVIINVAPAPNIPPAANAGGDQSIQLPANSVSLSGAASSDADGTISSYAWSYVSGPAQYNIASPSGMNTTVNNLAAGVYVFRLVVTDNNGAWDDDTVVITVSAAPPPPNIPPVARAGNDQSIQLPANSVTLDGSASSDADGNITSYAWSRISGPAQYNISNANNAGTAVTNLVTGTYAFRLVVTDNNGATGSDTVVVNVLPAPPPPNVAPTANAGNDQWIQLPTNSVTLDGSASSDADGNITSYAWSKISGPGQFNIANANSVSTSVSNLVAGTYAFRLVVTDNNGAVDDDTIIVTVAAAPPPPNQAPVAMAGNDAAIYLPSDAVVLNGSASYDPDGSIAGYSWTRISGPAGVTIVNATTISASAVGLVAGEYVFELTVTDNNGATAADQVKITVMIRPNQPPIAKAGRDTTIAIPATTAWLSALGSRDPDGNVAGYEWKQLEGPASAKIQYIASPVTMISNLVAGDYQFELTITDDKGAKATDTVKVAVVNNFRYEESLTIYPNPVAGKAHVRCVSDSIGEIVLRIMDANGRFVKALNSTKGQSYFEEDIMLSELRPGIYYLEAIIGNQKRMIRKFIKQ